MTPTEAVIAEAARLRPRQYPLRRRRFTIVRGETRIQRCLREARAEAGTHYPVGHVNRHGYDLAVHEAFHRKLAAIGVEVEGV